MTGTSTSVVVVVLSARTLDVFLKLLETKMNPDSKRPCSAKTPPANPSPPFTVAVAVPFVAVAEFKL
jgi:hypothetical protein